MGVAPASARTDRSHRDGTMTPFAEERSPQHARGACPRCNRPVSIFHLAPPLRDFPLFREALYVAACGHAHPAVPVPTRDGGCWWVPIMGEPA